MPSRTAVQGPLMGPFNTIGPSTAVAQDHTRKLTRNNSGSMGGLLQTAPEAARRPNHFSQKRSFSIGMTPATIAPASGKLSMRRKTVDELRFQALGTKNEKNLCSGQMPTYFDQANCQIPSGARIATSIVQKKKFSPPNAKKEAAPPRFGTLKGDSEMRVFRSPSTQKLAQHDQMSFATLQTPQPPNKDKLEVS